jgi:site-specific DNA-cytosine methylase
MAEIAAVPWNGFRAVSTFSGCGGSCLGYRMAGFRVLWASEFIPAAQETYQANHPDCTLDTRDIRQVQPAEIVEAIGLGVGELDLLDGSPPCASFSTAGKREAGWGKVKTYSDTRQRTDDLFFEYARILKGLRPKVFVAENVSGLVKGAAKGYFLEILAALKGCGYRVKAKRLDAQWLGVPQVRQRLIFQGVRQDLGLDPAFPKPLPYRYTVADALPWIKAVRWDGKGSFRPLARSGQDPAMTITVNNDQRGSVELPGGAGGAGRPGLFIRHHRGHRGSGSGPGALGTGGPGQVERHVRPGVDHGRREVAPGPGPVRGSPPARRQAAALPVRLRAESPARPGGSSCLFRRRGPRLPRGSHPPRLPPNSVLRPARRAPVLGPGGGQATAV